MKRLALPAVFLLAVCGGCTSTSLRGQEVRVTKYESDVAGCRFIEEIHSWDNLRNRAADLGGDVAVWTVQSGKPSGKVYDCGGRFKKP